MESEDIKKQTERLLLAAQAKYPHIERPADLVRQLGIDHQRFTNWKRRGIPASQLFNLADKFDCDARWLASGEGTMKSELQELNIDIRDSEFIDFVQLWHNTPEHLRPYLNSLAGTVQQLQPEYKVDKKKDIKNGTEQ